MKPYIHKYTKKNEALFSLSDQLSEVVQNKIIDAVVFRPSNRLDIIEQGAKEAERLAKEMQELVKSMRRK